MSPIVIRLIVLAAVVVGAGIAVLVARVVVAHQRQLALTAQPLAASAATSAVRILAFSTPDCTQCHTMQTPVLHRVLAARGEAVNVEEIDALDTPELAQRYHIMTVPTTVVLDAAGKARAVNYGFANAQRLLTQIDAILAEAS
jgi:thioredoxin-like negative regulator of GroEL